MQQSEGSEPAVRATVNYFDPTLARGRFDLVEPTRNLMSFEAHDVGIRDIRSAREPMSLDAQGFMLAAHSSRVARTHEIAETNLTAQSGLPPVNEAY
ncbi:MAG: hypothetical protein ABI885_28885 [Gammaproteobacteria bacterium]